MQNCPLLLDCLRLRCPTEPSVLIDFYFMGVLSACMSVCPACAFLMPMETKRLSAGTGVTDVCELHVGAEN